MTTSACLCGDVTWELEGPLRWMTHCHCSRCRKSHGTAYATYVGGRVEGFRLRGEPSVASFQSSPEFVRRFCRTCGSVVPGEPMGKTMFVPAGNFDAAPTARPEAHIFAASKAGWFEIHDALPRFEGYPPGFDAEAFATRPPLDPPGAPRGSCLCGAVTFVVEGAAIRCSFCHCSRCQRSRSAAFSTNLVTALDGVRFTRGAALVTVYKVPEAKHYAHAFCRLCGSTAPRLDETRGIALTPLGSMDDLPATFPQAHIFAASKAAWDVIDDGLPQYDEYPSQI